MTVLAFFLGFGLGAGFSVMVIAWAFGDAFDMRGRGPKR